MVSNRPTRPVRRRSVSVSKTKSNSSSSGKRSNVKRSIFLRQLFLGMFLLILLALSIAAVWYGTRLEILTITEVDVSGGETISHEEVQKIVEAELQGEYYRLIPKRFAWFYPEEVILNKVKERPRVKDAVLKLEDNNTISVTLSEYYPHALWCNFASQSDRLSQCFFLDAEGYSFIAAPPLAGSSMLRYFDPNKEPKAGEKAFEESFINTTSRLALLVIRDIGFSISHIEKVSGDEAQLHIAGGGTLRISLKQTVEDTFNNLVAILEAEEFAHIAPGNFQYIDLRFGNKVFVNEELPEDAEEGATATSSGNVIELEE